MTKKLITSSMTFAELMQYPEAVEVLMKKGFHCIGCSAAAFETIEQGAQMHGINPKKLVDEINKKVSSSKSKTKKIEKKTSKIKTKKKK